MPTTTKLRLEYAETLDALKRIAATRPETRTSSLDYRHEDDLIGTMLREKGFDAWEHVNAKHMRRVSQDVIEAHLKTHCLLRLVQEYLDYRHLTWAKAVERAERWIERHPDAWSWVDWDMTKPVITDEDKKEAMSRAW